MLKKPWVMTHKHTTKFWHLWQHFWQLCSFTSYCKLLLVFVIVIWSLVVIWFGCLCYLVFGCLCYLVYGCLSQMISKAIIIVSLLTVEWVETQSASLSIHSTLENDGLIPLCTAALQPKKLIMVYPDSACNCRAVLPTSNYALCSASD